MDARALSHYVPVETGTTQLTMCVISSVVYLILSPVVVGTVGGGLFIPVINVMTSRTYLHVPHTRAM